MSLLTDPSGRPLRSFGAFGTRKKLPVERLEVGMMLCEHLFGRAGRVLVCEGETLTKLHVDSIKEWIKREGEGCLLNYTREVWVKATLASGEERPKCEKDVYAAHSIQKIYKKGMGLKDLRPKSKPSAARAVYKWVGGQLVEVQS